MSLDGSNWLRRVVHAEFMGRVLIIQRQVPKWDCRLKCGHEQTVVSKLKPYLIYCRKCHAEAGLERMNRRREEFAADGLCTICGAEAVWDRKMCSHHLAMSKEYSRKRRARLREAR